MLLPNQNFIKKEVDLPLSSLALPQISPQSCQMPVNEALRRKKGRPKSDSVPKKTILAPGLAAARTAQACDRCRAKKQKCDGKLPACSSCASIGIKCIVLDKLSRRAFPKGYTETLEERVRQLEAENTKLQGLLDLRDEQLALNTSKAGRYTNLASPDGVNSNNDHDNDTNTTDVEDVASSVLHTHQHDAGCQCCSNPHAVHDRPVSIAGSVYDGVANMSLAGSVFSDDDEETQSLLSMGDSQYSVQDYSQHFNYLSKEVKPAPGAFAAATAIEQMQKKGTSKEQAEEEIKLRTLTSLVAASIPRCTEETLFIPTLLARICQVYGYGSKPSIITANAIASLKENSNLSMSDPTQLTNMAHASLLSLIMDKSTPKLNQSEAIQFLNLIQLPPKVELDHLMTVYFQNWGNVCPILSKNSFLKNYVRLSELLENSSSSALQNSIPEHSYELIEKLGALMVLVVALGLLSKKFTMMETKDTNEVSRYIALLNHFDKLIHDFIKPNCSLTKYCSIQSLQILTLALQYCLVVGDVTTCYELRARVVTMAQQLRLHRCPAAVLGLSKDANNVHLQNFMQGERRILFWCIYCLDTYSSLSLGIPRLFKDHEIECALPFSGNSDDDSERDNENILVINNTKLTIFGKVSKIALTTMQYCKVLGNILDSIFSRSGGYDVQAKALEKDQILDCWRRELPAELKFDIDVNGFSLKDNSKNKLNGGSDSTNWSIYSKQQQVLIFLYYHAKILIYLPIISKYGYHHNVGMSFKERLSMGQRDVSTVVLSMTMIQQSSIQILEVLKSVSGNQFLLPVPLNIPREQARFALLVAKGSLDYIKGGPLHQNLKMLLLDTLASFKLETETNIPGGLTRNSQMMLEYAIWSILGLNMASRNGSNSLRKQVLYNQPFKKIPSREQSYSVKQEFPNDFNHSESLTAKNIQVLEREQLSHQYPPAVQHQPSVGQFPNEFQPNATNVNNMALEENRGLSSSMNESSSSNVSTGDQFDSGFEDILKFDPFKMNCNDEILVNEFVADGSLGLVPFLNETSDAYHNDEDRLSDREDDVGAFSFNW
ncbi:CIC11C00000003435 [Sungouiella intermedia]|uniref:CIC11C00000003435 n=1 Tax=Sungouiella intermedia TaxID=45354 RepID=A0A1L0BP51_9ASCO|nr:CIC11C00000003435 [[Candida] intermedia]